MSGTEGVGQFFLMLFPLLMIMAGAGDVMTRRIPNALIIGTVVLFFPAALVTGMPLWIMSLHVATAALLLLQFLAKLVQALDARHSALANRAKERGTRL